MRPSLIRRLAPLVLCALFLCACTAAPDAPGTPESKTAPPISPTPLVEQTPEPTPSPTPMRANRLPGGFVYLKDVAPAIIEDMRYATSNNYVAEPLDGYLAPVAIVSAKAASALKQANDALMAKGYTLKVYDCYRPTDAVAHFVRWSKQPDDPDIKARYYPGIKSKSELFKLGFIAKKSGHSRGSTVDITIVYSDTGEEVDMGTIYDFFGPESHPASAKVSARQSSNRKILSAAMVSAGFRAISTEWWHFVLRNEPFPDKYFNFPVE